MAVLVALVAVAVYANTLWCGFVFDDGHVILNNEWITDFSYIGEVFLSSAWGFEAETSSNYYRPLMHVVFMIDYHIYGLSPWGYHLVNIIVHAVNSILVYLLACYLFCADEGNGEGAPVLKGSHLALASALLFAVHPVHVEAVAWVSAISELGFTLFFLLSLYLHIEAFGDGAAPRRSSRILAPLSWLSFIAALLFKETGVMLFFVVVAFNLSFKKKGERVGGAALRRYPPYIIILGAYIIVKLVLSGGLVPNVQHEELSGFQYFINIFPLIMDYIRLIIFPVDLNVFYIFHPVLSLFDFRLLASIIIIIPFVVLFVINVRNKERAATFAWLLALLSIMPALYIAGAGARGSAFAERYLYLPSAGFFIFIIYWFACFLGRLGKREAKVIFVTAIVLVCGVFAALTIMRNNVWKDNYTLWEDTARKTKDSELVYVNLGSAADALGHREEALRAYERALEINPRSAEAHNNLGTLFFEIKEYDLALANYSEGLKETTNPGNRVMINENMGNVYYNTGRFEEAAQRYRIAVEIKGKGLGFKEANLFYKLGLALARSGRLDEAKESFKRVLELNPAHVGAKEMLKKIGGASGSYG
jgi:tetratricopeptide (TPR) repeat protein